jgi:transcriptional regulator with XRE-family HTH domain
MDMTKEDITVTEKSLFKGYKLKELLDLRGLTQEKLQELTGVDQTTISNIILEKNNPQPETVNKLCEGLKMHYSYFYSDDDIPIQTLNLPPHLRQFVLETDSLDYLRLSEKAKRINLPPEAIEKIIEALEVAYEQQKK